MKRISDTYIKVIPMLLQLTKHVKPGRVIVILEKLTRSN